MVILVIPLLLVALLVLPFLFNDLDGVHRWLSFGPINLYIASIILPLLIIHLWKLALNNREDYVIGLTIYYISNIAISARCRSINRICMCNCNHCVEKD